MSQNDINVIIAKTSTLISYPKAALEIQRVINDDDSTMADIVRLIELDPALAFAVIRTSNSAAFNTGIEISSITKAVSKLGQKQVGEIVTAVDAARSFNQLHNDLWNIADFWQHSISCAVLAKTLAKTLSISAPDTAFTGGLLHDIGELILFSQLPEESTACLQTSLLPTNHEELFEIETRLLGFSHADVGGALAKDWSLPDSLIDCILHHHTPSSEVGTHMLTKIIHVANSLSVLIELDSDDIDDAPAINSKVYDELKLDTEIIQKVITAARSDIQSLSSLFND